MEGTRPFMALARVTLREKKWSNLVTERHFHLVPSFKTYGALHSLQSVHLSCCCGA
jgi:hypothetical protein